MTETSTLRKFLLDDLDEERKQAVEDLMFSDDDIFRRLCVLDDELVESYVRGELSSEDSQRLFRRLSSSERGRRTLDFMVEMADRAKASAPAAVASPALAAQQAQSESPPRIADDRPSFFEELAVFFRGFTIAPRAAMVLSCLLVAAIALPFFRLEQARNDLALLGEEKAALAERVEVLESRPGQEPVQAAFTLTPVVRAGVSSTEPELAVGPGTRSLELWLDPGGVVTYPELRARLRLAGEDVWSVDGLSTRQDPEGGLFVPVDIPTRLLEPGSYEVLLEGLGEDRYREVARYPFRFATLDSSP